jgi:hypothetical protein
VRRACYFAPYRAHRRPCPMSRPTVWKPTPARRQRMQWVSFPTVPRRLQAEFQGPADSPPDDWWVETGWKVESPPGPLSPPPPRMQLPLGPPLRGRAPSSPPPLHREPWVQQHLVAAVNSYPRYRKSLLESFEKTHEARRRHVSLARGILVGGVSLSLFLLTVVLLCEPTTRGCCLLWLPFFGTGVYWAYGQSA